MAGHSSQHRVCAHPMPRQVVPHLVCHHIHQVNDGLLAVLPDLLERASRDHQHSICCRGGPDTRGGHHLDVPPMLLQRHRCVAAQKPSNNRWHAQNCITSSHPSQASSHQSPSCLWHCHACLGARLPACPPARPPARLTAQSMAHSQEPLTSTCCPNPVSSASCCTPTAAAAATSSTICRMSAGSAPSPPAPLVPSQCTRTWPAGTGGSRLPPHCENEANWRKSFWCNCCRVCWI